MGWLDREPVNMWFGTVFLLKWAHITHIGTFNVYVAVYSVMKPMLTLLQETYLINVTMHIHTGHVFN